MICAACGADLGRWERVGRRDACPRCAADLRACRQCRFFDPAVADACREPQAERVAEKARANFCDYFAVAERGASAPAGAPADARAALDRLFARR
ncbi:MAG: hypothetical protein IT293_16075 [Deltaproteobacteria bacterium]|nr:hypothetical protein [Deltaproteobacteria bacterium]